ncbi:molybdopterin biosynthesis protein [Methanolobus halotolerans]|uniref:Molybdopterin biosynthesis protein n=1 Tax=Methanolobus halotolerans TaxID=2052935 RepID=A0A4E0Q2Z6_9EURY|nr:molybdopterin biosynthesis protein [Methanolobus halotolerans]TGC07316.1 molybdopterin biosynthesis protein [Methanolobus halotolerans]
MERKEFRELTPVKEARKLISRIIARPGIQTLTIENSAGRILAEDIFSPVDVPAFNRSVKDGYAIRAKDTYRASEPEPMELKMTASIPAGCADSFFVNDGETAEISTGAPIPEGADAVVMVEQTKQIDSTVFIYQPVYINENIMKAGSDIMKGERVLRKNTRIGSREIGVLASVGMKEVPVKELLVGIISTGNELIEPGNTLGKGLIFDANSYAIAASVEEAGGIPKIYGIIPDDWKLMEEALYRAIRECHIVLTSGSTSAGVGDIMYMIIEEKGETLTHGIAIKPGKPVVIGMIEGVPTIGLPGNPTSALSIFNEFVAPIIHNSLGTTPSFRTKVRAVMGTGIRSGGREELFPVGVVRGRAYPADKTSGAITTLSDADGIIEIKAETEYIEAGSPVEITMFGNVRSPDLMYVGGQCPGIDLLEETTGMVFRMLNMSSSAGFTAIAGATTDIAGVNMPADPDGEYNLPTARKMNLSGTLLVKGYKREMGLIFRQGTRISGLEDLAGLRFLNRNRGSGTRAVLEMELGLLAKEKGITRNELTKDIDGYNSGSKTHRSVCDAIKDGRADVGFGLRAAAREAGLGFLPVTEDEFDLLIREDVLDVPEIRLLLKTLTSEEFSKSLPPGMRTYERTGEMISSF